MGTPSDEFFPARLRMARELRGLTQAKVAAASGLSAAAVSQFESGAVHPRTDTRRELADALVVPPDFFAETPPATHDGFFRSLRRTRVSDRRRARALALIVHDMALGSPLPRADIPRVPITDLDAPTQLVADAAMTLRRTWQVPDGPVGNVVRLLEEHGALVVRLPLATADVDAFSLPFDDRPVVVLGADKNDAGRSRFDAAHELGHLVMHGQQVWGLKEVETQAHKFAAAFLMPEDQIRPYLPERADWAILFDLKQHWRVSLAALLMRARDLGVMSPSQYLTGVKYMSARGWRMLEPVPLGSTEVPDLTLKVLRGQSKVLRSRLPQDVMTELLGAANS